MKLSIRKLRRENVSGAFVALALATSALPITNVRADILIGQTAGFTGAVAAGVAEISQGAKLYFDAVNAKGGVGGQKINLITMDDKFDAKLAAENTRTLIKDREVVAMFLSRGTPVTEAMIPVLDEFNVPLIGPSTGAMSLHEPLRKNVFNVRSTYQREAELAVPIMKSLGLTRIAVLHADDSFGQDALVGLKKGFASAKLDAILVHKFERSKPDFSQIALDVAKSGANAVVGFGSSAAISDALKAIRAAGSRAQLVTLSNNASSGFVKALGDDARGTVVMQVFPSDRSSPLYSEVARVAKAKGMGEVSPAIVEGYAAARVMVEALKRAGSKPTGAKIAAALESLRNLDLGGLKLSYSATDHTGIEYADLSVVNREGRFVR
jgi:branched-chain amino acid transport system substrate-binding protein